MNKLTVAVCFALAAIITGAAIQSAVLTLVKIKTASDKRVNTPPLSGITSLIKFNDKLSANLILQCEKP